MGINNVQASKISRLDLESYNTRRQKNYTEYDGKRS
jgi:hypothetical protein